MGDGGAFGYHWSPTVLTTQTTGLRMHHMCIWCWGASVESLGGPAHHGCSSFIVLHIRPPCPAIHAATEIFLKFRNHMPHPRPAGGLGSEMALFSDPQVFTSLSEGLAAPCSGLLAPHRSGHTVASQEIRCQLN